MSKEILKVNITEVPDIRGIVLKLLREIPNGMVTTYGDLAEAIGDKRAARAVGKIMSENRNPDKFPCWRVVRSDGKVGNYSSSGGRSDKIERMKKDGIRVENGKIIEFSRRRFRDFDTEKVLPKLREKQKLVSRLAGTSLQAPPHPERIGGVDVSYKDDEAVGFYVEMDANFNEIIYSDFIRKREKFPYIPTYLSFRELPILFELLDSLSSARKIADVIFVDGNGLLHPRGAGLATHLGVALDHPTIGIAKNLLMGKVNEGDLEEGEGEPVQYKDKILGYALKTKKNTNPIYVSIGHNVDLDYSCSLTKKAGKYKIPEPVRQAHLSGRSKIKSLFGSQGG